MFKATGLGEIGRPRREDDVGASARDEHLKPTTFSSFYCPRAIPAAFRTRGSTPMERQAS
jgi:hypothetical protein